MFNKNFDDCLIFKEMEESVGFFWNEKDSEWGMVDIKILDIKVVYENKWFCVREDKI